MEDFADAKTAWTILSKTFKRIDLAQLSNLEMTYAYHFTDLDWYCTVVLQGTQINLVEELLPEAETTLEMTSNIFHQVMTQQINIMYAHLSNQVRIAGSLANVLKLRTIVGPLSQAYRSVLAEANAEQDTNTEAEAKIETEAEG
jgi:putative sterol carrier protein